MELMQIQHLSKVYGQGENQVRAVDDISFTVEKGEFLAIIGPSGSGKSTLLHILGGVDCPTSGKVFVDGQDVYAQNEDQLAIFRRRQVGLIYQFYNLIPVLNVVENMTLPVLMDGRQVNQERLEELLDVVDAVVLCTPNQFHLPYTERAVERGKAVLLEKPLGLQTAPPGQAERLLARRDARVMVAYVYRYTAVVERLRALLRQRMGRVYLAQASQGGTRLADPAVPLEWRMRRSASGSGALGDFGSHLLDLLQYAAGVELAEAAGYGGTFLPTRRPDGQGNTCVENDDAFVFCGRGTGGALCSVSVSRVGLDGIHLCISGEGGLLRASVEEGVLTYWPKAPDGPYAPEGEARSEHLAEPPGLRFARQAAAFLDLVEGRPVEYCTLEQAVRLERLLTRLDQSAQ